MIKEIAKYQYEIQKSKFIGIAYNIDNLDMVDEILNKLKIENKKAKHICYGYKIEKVDKTILIKASDDKEPKGTASLPILNAINNLNYKNIALFIIRYFGGIKLGVGGLYRSYTKVALETLKLINI